MVENPDGAILRWHVGRGVDCAGNFNFVTGGDGRFQPFRFHGDGVKPCFVFKVNYPDIKFGDKDDSPFELISSANQTGVVQLTGFGNNRLRRWLGRRERDACEETEKKCKSSH